MKNLYHKSKGKVYPSPSAAAATATATTATATATIAINPPPSPSFPPNRDVYSVLNLLPTAIIALVSILSLQDREVLAYLITRSMKTTNPFSMDEDKNKYCKKTNSTHKPPIFDCGCFDCYTSYWFRWDSSPNRELIHQAIEAFEEHLTNGELSKKKNGKGGKKKDKTGRRGNEKSLINSKQEKDDNTAQVEEEKKKKKKTSSSFVSVLVLPTVEATVLMEKADDSPVGVSDFKSEDIGSKESREQVPKQLNEVSGELKETVEEEEEAVQLPASLNRGLARKVLPDVLGLFNSRLWSLWNPTV